MRKQLLDETPELELSEEQVATEMIELTCEDVDAITRAFNMIATLCEELQKEVCEDPKLDIPDTLIN